MFCSSTNPAKILTNVIFVKKFHTGYFFDVLCAVSKIKKRTKLNLYLAAKKGSAKKVNFKLQK